MNNTVVSISLIAFISMCGILIANFFDIDLIYYLPFLGWFIVLCIFNIFLDKTENNIYMEDILKRRMLEE